MDSSNRYALEKENNRIKKIRLYPNKGGTLIKLAPRGSDLVLCLLYIMLFYNSANS